MAGVVTCKLGELNEKIHNASVTALILSKNEPHFFVIKDTQEFRGVINLILRDSKEHVVNCKCWGSKDKITEYQRKLNIGDIIDVICPKVMPQAISDPYHPQSTLPYILILNEGQGHLTLHNKYDTAKQRELHDLWRVPHKLICNLTELCTISYSANSSEKINPNLTQSNLVDVLVLVALKRPVKKLRSSRTGGTFNCLELIVFDSSLPKGMVFTIWNTDWVNHAAKNWIPMKTVLYLIDVKVTYSDYYKRTVLHMNGRTFIYENPMAKETRLLLKYADNMPITDYSHLIQSGLGKLPIAAEIIQQMTVKQIYARAEGSLKSDAEEFTAVLYAMITQFDLDGFSSIIDRKCKSCQRLLPRNVAICQYEHCQLEFSIDCSAKTYESLFNINVHFSDHTGTLTESRLKDVVAERLLDGLKVNEFVQLTSDEKERVKWRFLLELFEVKLLIRKPTIVNKHLNILVIDMRPICLEEVSQKCLVF